jgi:hypothetical protein
MLASVVVRAGELLAVVLAAGAVTLAVGLWWLRRRVRRLRRAGRALAARARVVAVSAADAGRRRAWSVLLPDRRWLAAARERRRLWRAVGAAEHAVAAARRAGAPAGELDQLCRRLRQAAGNADRCLSVSRGGAGQGGSAEVSEVVAAAGVIAEAAASAAAAMTQSAYQDLAGDARREAEALAAGIAAGASLPGVAGGLPTASATG